MGCNCSSDASPSGGGDHRPGRPPAPPPPSTTDHRHAPPHHGSGFVTTTTRHNHSTSATATGGGASTAQRNGSFVVVREANTDQSSRHSHDSADELTEESDGAVTPPSFALRGSAVGRRHHYHHRAGSGDGVNTQQWLQHFALSLRTVASHQQQQPNNTAEPSADYLLAQLLFHEELERAERESRNRRQQAQGGEHEIVQGLSPEAIREVGRTYIQGADKKAAAAAAMAMKSSAGIPFVSSPAPEATTTLQPPPAATATTMGAPVDHMAADGMPADSATAVVVATENSAASTPPLVPEALLGFGVVQGTRSGSEVPSVDRLPSSDATREEPQGVADGEVVHSPTAADAAAGAPMLVEGIVVVALPPHLDVMAAAGGDAPPPPRSPNTAEVVVAVGVASFLSGGQQQAQNGAAAATSGADSASAAPPVRSDAPAAAATAPKQLDWSPSFAFNAKTLDDDDVFADFQECALCLEPMLDGDEIRVLWCDHFYHRSCVDAWLRKKRLCPICCQDVTKIDVRVSYSHFGAALANATSATSA